MPMEVETLKVGEVSEWQGNARLHTRRNLEALKESIRVFGQTKPILIQKSSMRIIAGNGTYAAIVALGLPTVDCRLLDLDDDRAEALAIADNRTGLLSQWDDKLLTESLERIRDNGDLALTGFDDSELDRMLQFQSGDAFTKIDVEPAGKPPKAPPSPAKPEQPAPSYPAEPQENTPADNSAPYDEQLSFVLDGFAFALADPREIGELRALLTLLKESDFRTKTAATNAVFHAISVALTDQFQKAR